MFDIRNTKEPVSGSLDPNQYEAFNPRNFHHAIKKKDSVGLFAREIEWEIRGGFKNFFQELKISQEQSHNILAQL